jgi:hypothetical protein
MPRIPDEYLHCSIYLYHSTEEAMSGKGPGGSGFILGLPCSADAESRHLLGVTNRHVVKNGAVVPRLTTIDGLVQAAPMRLEDWAFHPRQDDLALCYLGVSRPPHRYTWVPLAYLLSEDRCSELRIGPGDDVFMVGRFLDHDGKLRNAPSLWQHLADARGPH